MHREREATMGIGVSSYTFPRTHLYVHVEFLHAKQRKLRIGVSSALYFSLLTIRQSNLSRVTIDRSPSLGRCKKNFRLSTHIYIYTCIISLERFCFEMIFCSFACFSFLSSGTTSHWSCPETMPMPVRQMFEAEGAQGWRRSLLYCRS